MAKEIILSKESSESEIKAYFNEVLKLSQSDNEFPINFDEVWMLVYQDKHKAVNELKDKFIEGVDYQALTQKVECQNGIGYSRRIDYYLTVSCMEFFIARKVRPVFEVYRQVFHRTAQKVVTGEFSVYKQPTVSDKMKAATWVVKFLNLNEKLIKKFVDMKNVSTFVVRNILKGGKVRKYMWAIFMSARKHIRFHAPVSQVNATTAFEVLRNGSVWNRSFISAQQFNKQTF